MRLELERDLELFFFLKIEGNYLSSSFYLLCVAPLPPTLKEHL